MKTLVLAALCLVSVVTWAQPDYHKADSIALRYHEHPLTNLKALADKLTSPLDSDAEKFRSIYRWVCDNIGYDYSMNERNQHRRAKARTTEELKKWNDKVRTEVFRMLLSRQKTVCTGYAYLVRELSVLAGLRCVIIDGYGRTVQSNIGGSGVANHSWNAVELNGRWYLADPTWSTGAYDTQKHEFLRRYNNAYFLADPELFIRNHYPLDSTWTLLKNSPDLNEFLNRPLIYSDAYDYRISHLYPDTYTVEARKGDAVTFKLRGHSTLSAGKFELKVARNGGNMETFPIQQKEHSDGYSFDHTFASKGEHTVHLLINNRYVATYRAIVK